MNEANTPSIDLARVADLAKSVRENVQRVIVGKSSAIDLAMTAILCGGHALIEDIPGTGKTTLAKALAASLGCRFNRLQFTPDLVPADVLGVNMYDAEHKTFHFQPGPVFSQILLADEINRASPRTQSALLEAMAEQQVSIDGETTNLPAPFFVIATLNPVEMEGTFPLPEAQLDRFLLRFDLGYPDVAEEAAILERYRERTNPIAIDAVATPEEIIAAQKVIGSVQVSQTVQQYILDIVGATRTRGTIQLGASPRATLALQRAAQANAAINSRDYVLPDDVKALVIPVLAHRIVLDIGSELRGSTDRNVLTELLEEVPVPLEPSP